MKLAANVGNGTLALINSITEAIDDGGIRCGTGRGGAVRRGTGRGGGVAEFGVRHPIAPARIDVINSLHNVSDGALAEFDVLPKSRKLLHERGGIGSRSNGSNIVAVGFDVVAKGTELLRERGRIGSSMQSGQGVFGGRKTVVAQLKALGAVGLHLLTSVLLHCVTVLQRIDDGPMRLELGDFIGEGGDAFLCGAKLRAEAGKLVGIKSAIVVSLETRGLLSILEHLDGCFAEASDGELRVAIGYR